jgi:hypothetical protein
VTAASGARRLSSRSPKRSTSAAGGLTGSCGPELALTLQVLVAPGEPAAGVWALLRGYPLKQLPPAAEQALSVARWLLGELKSEDAWKETLTDYVQAPELVRAFVVDDPKQVARARTPGIASDRHDVYAAVLRRLPPHQVFEMPIAEGRLARHIRSAPQEWTRRSSRDRVASQERCKRLGTQAPM